jgi:hypothetical protein
LVMVTLPVTGSLALTVRLVILPLSISTMPELAKVTVPVELLTLTPNPATADRTPALVTVTAPAAPLTLILRQQLKMLLPH